MLVLTNTQSKYFNFNGTYVLKGNASTEVYRDLLNNVSYLNWYIFYVYLVAPRNDFFSGPRSLEGLLIEM